MPQQFTRKVLANAVTLTGTPVASTGELVSASDQFALYLNWTPAAAARTLTVTIEVSPDGNDLTNPTDANAAWHQYGEYDYSDADTKGRKTFNIEETSAAGTAVKLEPFIFACPASRIRIKFSESGGGGGTITATLLYRAS